MIMYVTVQIVIVISLSFSCIRSNVIWKNPNELHPVHGLYVKPSNDGATGDLYVAASEDNGIKSQWLTDQPINFLTKASKRQPKVAPVSLTSSVTKTKTPQEEIITTQKQAVVTSPAIKYAYALPIPGAEGNVAPYQYAIPANLPNDPTVLPPCSLDIPTQPYPISFFYPHMMSAIASSMNTYKESEGNDEKSPVTAPTPYWPPPYGYPYQYILLDPSMWAQSQTNVSPLESPNTNSSESE